MRVVLAVVALTVAIVVIVFGFKLTFGQRCAERYIANTAEWSECVTRLDAGGDL